MPQHQLVESGEKMSTDEKPGRNEPEYFVKRDAELILEIVEELDRHAPGFMHNLPGLIRR